MNFKIRFPNSLKWGNLTHLAHQALFLRELSMVVPGHPYGLTGDWPGESRLAEAALAWTATSFRYNRAIMPFSSFSPGPSHGRPRV